MSKENIDKKERITDGVLYNSISILIITITIIINIKYYKGNTKKTERDTMYGFLMVSLLMTIAETVFVYYNNVQQVRRIIINEVDEMINETGGLNVRDVLKEIPGPVVTKLKRNYDDGIKNIGFVLIIPILILSILVITVVKQLTWSEYSKKDYILIILNTILLIIIFGATFINLGTKCSNMVSIEDIVVRYDYTKENERNKKEINIFDKKMLISVIIMIISSIILPSIFIFNNHSKKIKPKNN